MMTGAISVLALLLVLPTGPGWAVGSVPGLPGWLAGYSRWVSHLPAYLVWLWLHVRALWWPWLPLAALLVVLAGVVLRLARRAGWRRAVAGGYWLAITPPRWVDPGGYGAVWPLLRPLAVRARGGRWRLARPPLAFEVHGDGRALRAGLWLPGWVPPDTASDAVSLAWPGATVARTDPPTLAGAGPAVAGVRLVPDRWHPETGWLVANIAARSGSRQGGGADADLGAVFTALGVPDAVTLLQVLVRPATRRRLRHLAAAGQRPVKPLSEGWRLAVDIGMWTVALPVRMLLAAWDWWFTRATPGTAGGTRAQPPSQDQRDAMGVARKKTGAGPHLLVSIRIGATGWRRRDAYDTAQSVGYGFGVPSRLEPTRLGRAAAVLAARWARGGDWMLVTPAELGVLAHLPPDPALYGFDTAALHRPVPVGVAHARPERAGPTLPGWTPLGWTQPPTTPADHDTDPGPDEDAREHEHQRGPESPAPRMTPYLTSDGEDWGVGDDHDAEGNPPTR